MTTIINGSSPSITFSDTTTQTTAGLTGSTQQLCQAWVTYKGTSTQAILASYNVSSVTNNGTGDYTINFTTAFADANYCPVYGATANLTAGNWAFVTGYLAGQTTTSLRILIKNDAGTGIDSPSVAVAIHR
jgi:hypothetical protein